MGSINDHIRGNILPGESISINDRLIAYFSRQFLGDGSPEGVVSAPVGSTYIRRNGGAGTTFYVKESGSGNTGWTAKSSAYQVSTLSSIVYDVEGRVVSYLEDGVSVVNTYDALGRLSTITFSGTTRTLSYNETGQLVGVA